MLDPRRLLEDPAAARKALARRGAAAVAELEPFFALEVERRELIKKVDELRARRNRTSESLKTVDKTSAAFAAAREEMREVGAHIQQLEKDLAECEARRDAILLRVPNWPHASVPDGVDETGNVEVARVGAPPVFDFSPLPHDEIGTRLGILDFERAAKISGARFCVLRGAGARLERALLQFMLDLHTRDHGYVEVWPPFLVKTHAMEATGQLPKFELDAFKTTGDDPLFLVPTAEVPVTNLHRDEVIDVSALPIRYCAYTPCFRAEAGSYGKDVKGLIRQHQFDKVELVCFTTPETSYEEHERLRGHAEVVLQRLGLHYRVVSLCTGDLGANAAKCYDIEVWLPSQKVFREISSCSNFEDYQARRAKIRFKEGRTDKPRLVHTLNGSALAIGRTMVAILEQHQRRDGSVVIPQVLRPYMGGQEVIAAA